MKRLRRKLGYAATGLRYIITKPLVGHSVATGDTAEPGWSEEPVKTVVEKGLAG